VDVAANPRPPDARPQRDAGVQQSAHPHQTPETTHMTLSRTSRRHRRLALLAAALGTTAAILAPVVAASADPAPGPRVDVIATGLNNPRGVTVNREGDVYVAEAGLGAGNATVGVVAGIGSTGSITKVDDAGSRHAHQRRIVSGIASAASVEQGQLEALGIDGITVGRDHGHEQIWGVLGTGGVPNTNLGYLVKVRHHSLVDVAAVGAADLAWTATYQHAAWAPPGQFPDANPYGVLVSRGRRYVVDAASNTVDVVTRSGAVKQVAYIPNPPVSDSVPTCIAQGPDGAVYVGTLNLVGFFGAGPGQSTVYRIDPKTLDPSNLNAVLTAAKPWATGFSTITGCTISHGRFYATEMFTNDVQVASLAHPSGARVKITAPQIVQPNGIAVSGRNIYVSTHSDSTGGGAGQLVRIRLGR
jgi:hypothetical protein